MNSPDTPSAPRRHRVFRCRDGCYHLQWDALLLNLTPEEFRELHALMGRAAAAQHAPGPTAEPDGVAVERAH